MYPKYLEVTRPLLTTAQRLLTSSYVITVCVKKTKVLKSLTRSILLWNWIDHIPSFNVLGKIVFGIGSCWKNVSRWICRLQWNECIHWNCSLANISTYVSVASTIPLISPGNHKRTRAIRTTFVKVLELPTADRLLRNSITVTILQIFCHLTKNTIDESESGSFFASRLLTFIAFWALSNALLSSLWLVILFLPPRMTIWAMVILALMAKTSGISTTRVRHCCPWTWER